MRIGCDLTPLSKPRRGISDYLSNLLRELLRVPQTDEWVGYLHDGPDPTIPGLKVRRGREWTRRIHALWMQTEGMRLALADRLELFWATCYLSPRAVLERVPMVATVYDVVWKVVPRTMRLRTRVWVQSAVRRALRAARVIVCISRSTARDLGRFYDVDPAKVRVIYPGTAPWCRALEPEEARRWVRRVHGIQDRYTLAVGTIEARKNLPRLLEAHAASPDAPELVIVGDRGWGCRETLARIAGASRVRWLQQVPDDHLVWLYSGAEFLAYPSLYEGFGLPVIDAMACGCPVLASNVSSVPEATGDAALLVDPLDGNALAQAIRRLSEDGALRAKLREAGLRQATRFTWRGAAAQYREAFTSAVQG